MARRKKADQRQLSFNPQFLLPDEPSALPGEMNFDGPIRELLSRSMSGSKYDRYAIASQMSRLLGKDVGKGQLDAWSAPSKEEENRRFPLTYLPAFMEATESLEILRWLAQKMGCKLLVGREVLLAELGRLDREEAELKSEKSELRKRRDEIAKFLEDSKL